MSSQELYLVTGANGYIASALVRQLLQDGKQVRATVRRQQAGDELRAALPTDAKGTLEIAIVPDIIAPGAFKEALQGATHVFHVASPLPGEGTKDAKRDLLDPAKLGALTLLEDASGTPSVQKVVLTSSVVSIIDVQRLNTGGKFTEDDWNPITYDQAIELGRGLESGSVDPMVIYAASKKVAEEAAWRFVRERKPTFAFAVVNPGVVLGKPELPGLSGTNGLVWQALSTRPLQPEFTQPFGFVDIADVVQGHIGAMQREEANGKRFILVSHQPSYPELINLAKDHRPDLPLDRVEVPTDAKDKESLLTRIDNTASRQLLGLKYRSVQRTIADYADWISTVVNA